MLQRCLVLLIFVGLLEPVLACTIIPPKREIKVEIVQGLGGDCYYKRIPQTYIGQNWEYEESWRTEFYTSKNSNSPVFKKSYYFEDSIACLEDETGNKRISLVNSRSVDNVNSEGWLEFLVDDQTVKSYAPLDIIESEKNAVFYDDTCGSGLEASRSQGFVLDKNRIVMFMKLSRLIIMLHVLTF